MVGRETAAQTVKMIRRRRDGYMNANATTTMETMTIRCVTVRPTLLDVDWFHGQGVPCCGCGANIIRGDQRMSEGAIRRRDGRGEYVECEACGVRHYAEGGRFLFHGDTRTRIERWCSTCGEWRPHTETETLCSGCGSRLQKR